MHQLNSGAALDFRLPPARDGNDREFDQVYDTNARDRAPLAWCLLAQAAWTAGGRIQTIVENSRSNRPGGEIYRNQFFWRDGSVLDADGTDQPNSCVDRVRGMIEVCLSASFPDVQGGDYSPDQRARCSPNHIHTARQ